MAQSTRPISPHLTVYRWQITLAMSIVHRITGMGLYFGFALLTWWLMAAAWSEEALGIVNKVMGHPLGLLVLFGFTWALFHHMLGGIRHFIWDSGRGFSAGARFALGWLTLIGGVVLTVLVWLLVLWM